MPKDKKMSSQQSKADLKPGKTNFTLEVDKVPYSICNYSYIILYDSM
jgi:hypothetical protein